MSSETLKLYPAHIAGIVTIAVAVAAFFVHPVLTVILLLLYVVICVIACFFPQMNFLGTVISRGQTKENKVALTFDDGPDQNTTERILDVLDRHNARATFFVTGVNASKHPGLIMEIVRRGHEIGNHSLHHDPLIMLKGYRRLCREVEDAQTVLGSMRIDTRVFRPPVGIVNPQLFPVLRRSGLLCVTFSCRPWDAGNLRMKNLAEKILKKVKADDIILLHDKLPHRPEDESLLFIEIEKILAGLTEKRLSIVPLSELIGYDPIKAPDSLHNNG